MNDIELRAIDEPQWPNGGGFGYVHRGDRNYTVNQFGQPVSTIPAGGFQRGTIVRRFQPAFRPPRLGEMAYDVTDPATWPTNMKV